MAQSFSFGFDSEDIEGDAAEQLPEGSEMMHVGLQEQPALLLPRLHTLDELLSQLPSRITYAKHLMPSTSSEYEPLYLPRRDIFDIRAQIMAEEDIEKPADQNATGLLSDDIVRRVYEGGFKTWECSIDLAVYIRSLIDNGKLKLGGKVHIVELGAGTGVPTACILSTLLGQSRQLDRPLETRITLADYNVEVLALATIPNLLLSVTHEHGDKGEGDLDLSPTLMSTFKNILRESCINISAVSGAWSPAFVEMALAANGELKDKPVQLSINNSSLTLILASETIYSPESVREFAQTVLSLLSNSKVSPASHTLALIAAKRVYFGVGGGISEFMTVLEELGGWGKCVWDSNGQEGESKGVERCILEVGLREL